MATNRAAARRYQAAYMLLLRLYPRSFRERFAESMLQPFGDLCREHPSRLPRLALRVFAETSAAILKENLTSMPKLGKTILRAALVALALLMVPLAASRGVEGWNWPPGAFVFVYGLFFATGLVYALIARRMGVWSYKVGVGMSLAAGFVLGWSTMVHVTGTENPANFLYFTVLAVGAAGALIARLQARGMAHTLFAVAAVLAVISLLLPSGAPPDMAQRMAIGHGVLTVLFTASGLLFRHASLERVQ